MKNLTELINKYGLRETDLKILDSNFNDNIIAYSELLNKKVYIKIFSDKSKFACEQLILDYFSNETGFIISGELSDNYYCICDYKEYKPFKIRCDEDIINVAKLISNFHSKTMPIIDKLPEYEKLSCRIKRSMGEVKEISPDENLLSAYYNLMSHSALIDIEQESFPPVCLHGDFGERNIVQVGTAGTELKLIDFERVKKGVYWQDFIKFFERELIEGEKRILFIRSYEDNYYEKIKIPSGLFTIADKFYNVLGIYKYTSKFVDVEFWNMGQKMLNEVNDYIRNNIKIIDTLVGLAIGDATGVAATHYDAYDIMNVYGKKIDSIYKKIHKFGESKAKYKKGEVTDDTMQTLCVLDSYIKFKVIDRQQQALALIILDDKYIKPTTSSGQIKTSQKLNHVSWKGLTNGSITRAVAIGIISYLKKSNDDELISDVVECITITHNTYEALSGAIFIASILSATLSGSNIYDAYKKALKILSKYEKEQNLFSMSENIKIAVKLGPEQYIREVVKKGGEWGFLVRESVPVISSILLMDLSVRESILYSANLGGDADSISAIIGAIIASIKGIDNLNDFINIIANENRSLLCKILELSDSLTGFDVFFEGR